MNIRQALSHFGADSTSLRLFEAETPDLLPYATLLSGRAAGDQDIVAISAAYEWQGAPLLYLVDADLVRGDPIRLSRLRRILAMRGDAPYLGVISPGRLEVYAIALDSQAPDQARVALSLPESDQFATLAFLANNRPGTGKAPWISKVVLDLLSASIEGLTDECGVSGDDAISLVGRALFTRFLADRELLTKPNQKFVDASELFDSPFHAKQTSDWLDATFNGDFLPLTENILGSLPNRAYGILGDVMRRAPSGQLHLGWKERWDHLDFAHIPVGVLSQAYENFLRLHTPGAQRRDGGYYTPQPIAELMVKGAFRALNRKTEAHKLRVLDPAVGAGIFLLAAFRSLVAARWEHDGKRPDTQVLREIVYQQITGFDINEAALRFAALGLYLLAIELDPHPEPVRKLKFRKMRNGVLQKFESTPGEERSLGSLGPDVKQEHIGRYDLVIGNPPWMSGTRLPNWSSVKRIVGEIAKARLGVNAAPPLPNEVLDLPFVWRATEWAKPGGQIVFALHGRLLFQQGDGMFEARKALFRAISVSSIVNGAELRQTKVWPEISAPFCILFARNQLPPEGSGFRLVTPRIERSLNDSGNMRIDAASAEMVTLREVIECAPVLKVLSRGSRADLEVYERISSESFLRLGDYWSKIHGMSGNGYQRLRPSSRIRKHGDGLKGVSADHLKGLSEITPASMQSVMVIGRSLKEFRERRIHDPRPRELFNGPLLLVRKSPPAGLGRIRVAVSKRDVVFNETYYGYSAYKNSDGLALLQYLAMIVGSKPTLWFALMTSGEFGIERDVIEKATIDATPIRPFERLSVAERKRCASLFEKLTKTDSAWDEIDSWAARLYGLRARDLEVINDTLKYSLPFAENRRRAQLAPSDEAIKAFCATLDSELTSWADRFGRRVTISPAPLPNVSPWRTVRLCAGETPPVDENRNGGGPLFEFFKLADHLAASEVICEEPGESCVLIGRLNQARYWTRTRARLVARQMIWEYPNLMASNRE